jgi:hypothetical protein
MTKSELNTDVVAGLKSRYESAMEGMRALKARQQTERDELQQSLRQTRAALAAFGVPAPGLRPGRKAKGGVALETSREF